MAGTGVSDSITMVLGVRRERRQLVEALDAAFRHDNTSSAVSGVPSWNLIFGRNWNCHMRCCGSDCHEVASCGWGMPESSSWVRRSKIRLSKLSRAGEDEEASEASSE